MYTVNPIHLPSYSGRELLLHHFSAGSDRLAVCFPGMSYPCEMPLLYYAGHAARQQQYDLLMLEYGYQAARTPFDPNDIPRIIEECLQGILRVAESYPKIVFISKSFGTYIAGETARKMASNFPQLEINHLYLTPLHYAVPQMLTSRGTVIWGTNDQAIDAEEVKQIRSNPSLELHAIEGADHALELPDLHDTMQTLAQIVRIYTEYFEKV